MTTMMMVMMMPYLPTCGTYGIPGTAQGRMGLFDAVTGETRQVYKNGE